MVVRTVTALQGKGFLSNYRTNHCEMEQREAEDDNCENSGKRAEQNKERKDVNETRIVV